jgi:FkbM family methyltransferase
MKLVYDLARKMQGLDQVVPKKWRVPFRYKCQRIFGGLEQEMRLLPKLVASGGLAVDVGGNRGSYTYVLSRLCRHVVTFEPIPDCAKVLMSWAEGRNVDIHECGLGDHEEKLLLHLPRVNGALVTTRASLAHSDNDGVDLSVHIKTLDQFGLTDVGFIKIDVEGFEMSTLKGAEDTLQRCRPNLLVEIDFESQTAEQSDATFAWLNNRNYQGHYFDGENLIPCGSDIRSKRMPVYNFIFLPVDSR